VAADGLRLTIQLLQDINQTISPVQLEGVRYDIQSTPDTYPATLEVATTPAILVFIEDVTVDWISQTESFNARMTCYLGSIGEGVYDDLLQAGLLFNQNLIELYGDLISTNGGSYILDYGPSSGYRIEITGEPGTATGIRSDFQYTKEEVYYWGFSLTLPIQLTWGVNC
jgi:hypothetical protein